MEDYDPLWINTRQRLARCGVRGKERIHCKVYQVLPSGLVRARSKLKDRAGEQFLSLL